MKSVLVVLLCFYRISADENGVGNVDSKAPLATSETRNNYTGNDLIQLLTRLANEEIAPRLRFPTDDYDDTPDDPYFANNQNYNQEPGVINVNGGNNPYRYPQNIREQQYPGGSNYNQDQNYNRPTNNIYQNQYNQNIRDQKYPGGVDFNQNQNYYRPTNNNYPPYDQYIRDQKYPGGIDQNQNYYRPTTNSPSQYDQNIRDQKYPGGIDPNQNQNYYRPTNNGYPSQYDQNIRDQNYPGATGLGQDQNYYRPTRKRRPKKRPYNYRPDFPISQDALDPYLQNYPPYPQQPPNGPLPFSQYPAYAQNFPQNPFNQGNFPQGYNLYADQGPFANLMNALNSIARHDDQQCVPRLLCEVAAGGNPSYRQNSFLPSFLNTESLFTLLSALSGSVSPLLVFGRAALLGVTSQGRPSSCRYAYPECPRDPDRLVEYLNNHNGGFFRFFNGLNGNHQDQQFNSNGIYSSQQNNDQQGSGLNQLSQLFGQLAQFNPNQQQNNRPINQDYNGNKRPSYPYNGELGNYQRYPFKFESQNRAKLNSSEYGNDTSEARILNRPGFALYDDISNDNRFGNGASSYDLYTSQHFNDDNTVGNFGVRYGAWRFPESNYFTKTNMVFPSSFKDSDRNQKGLTFPNDQSQHLYYPTPLPFYDHSKMIFPDRTGTGNLKFDSVNLGSVHRPDIYRNDVPSYNRGNYEYYPNRFGQSSSKKRYVYIVRGNGDPNNPEIVEEPSGRHSAGNVAAEETNKLRRADNISTLT